MSTGVHDHPDRLRSPVLHRRLHLAVTFLKIAVIALGPGTAMGMVPALPGGSVQAAAPVVAQAPVPLTLPAAVAQAVEGHPQVRAAASAARAAEAQVRLARAALGPSVLLTGGPTVTPAGVGGALSVGVTYLVYDGGVRQAQVRQAEAQAEAARLGLEATRAEVAFAAVQAFMNVVAGEQVVALREQAVAQARTQLQAAEANFRAGRVARADVVRAEAALAAAEVDLLDARGQLETRRTALRTALALEPGTPVAVTAPAAPPAVDVPEPAAVERALARPEVGRAAAEVRAAEAALAVAMFQGGVTATLDGRYVLVGTGTGATAGGTWSIGVGLVLPVYDAGRRAAQVEQARAALDTARARLEALRAQVRQEAVATRNQALTAAAKVEAARRSAEAAREALRVAEGRYAAGVGTLPEVTTARTDLAAAETALAQAMADRWTTLAAFRRATAQAVLP